VAAATLSDAESATAERERGSIAASSIHGIQGSMNGIPGSMGPVEGSMGPVMSSDGEAAPDTGSDLWARGRIQWAAVGPVVLVVLLVVGLLGSCWWRHSRRHRARAGGGYIRAATGAKSSCGDGEEEEAGLVRGAHHGGHEDVRGEADGGAQVDGEDGDESCASGASASSASACSASASSASASSASASSASRNGGEGGARDGSDRKEHGGARRTRGDDAADDGGLRVPQRSPRRSDADAWDDNARLPKLRLPPTQRSPQRAMPAPELDAERTSVTLKVQQSDLQYVEVLLQAGRAGETTSALATRAFDHALLTLPAAERADSMCLAQMPMHVFDGEDPRPLPPSAWETFPASRVTRIQVDRPAPIGVRLSPSMDSICPDDEEARVRATASALFAVPELPSPHASPRIATTSHVYWDE